MSHAITIIRKRTTERHVARGKSKHVVVLTVQVFMNVKQVMPVMKIAQTVAKSVKKNVKRNRRRQLVRQKALKSYKTIRASKIEAFFISYQF
jgi:ribonuclease P protein component